MVLTKEELITALQNEVRILVHLAGKVDRAKLDYRPPDRRRPPLGWVGPMMARYCSSSRVLR